MTTTDIIERPRKSGCMLRNEIKHIYQNCELLDLTLAQKRILYSRYIFLLKSYDVRVHRYSKAFHTLRVFVTIGSLITPGLLSVQNTTGLEQYSNIIYWSTWVISLLVTISNGLIGMYKIDKKYYIFTTIYEQLVSEGWQFIELSGKYSGFHTPGLDPNHKNQFSFFATAIEKIRMKQIEEEYFKLAVENEKGNGGGANGAAATGGTTASGETSGVDKLVPPSVKKTNFLENLQKDPNQFIEKTQELEGNVQKFISTNPASNMALAALQQAAKGKEALTFYNNIGSTAQALPAGAAAILNASTSFLGSAGQQRRLDESGSVTVPMSRKLP